MIWTRSCMFLAIENKLIVPFIRTSFESTLFWSCDLTSRHFYFIFKLPNWSKDFGTSNVENLTYFSHNKLPADRPARSLSFKFDIELVLDKKNVCSPLIHYPEFTIKFSVDTFLIFNLCTSHLAPIQWIQRPRKSSFFAEYVSLNIGNQSQSQISNIFFLLERYTNVTTEKATIKHNFDFYEDFFWLGKQNSHNSNQFDFDECFGLTIGSLCGMKAVIYSWENHWF